MSRIFDPLNIPLQGVQLIEASAGTGKTYSIASLFLLLLLEKRLPVDQILVVTFTEAATAELHDRIRERLRTAVQAFQSDAVPKDPILAELKKNSRDQTADFMHLKGALINIDEAAVSTIHGFCRRMLQQGAFESGVSFDLELIADIDPLVREVVEDYLVNALHGADPRLVSLLGSELNSKSLLLLAQEALRHQDYDIIPGNIGPQAVGGAIDRAILQYQKVRDSWRSQKEAIRQQLDPDIFMKDIRESLEQGMLDWLDGYLAHDDTPDFKVYRNAEKLCPQKFADPDGKVCKKAAIKKNAIPQHPFFDLWEEYIAALDAVRTTCRTSYLSGFVFYVRKELPQRMQASQMQSFDDLLHSLDKALQRTEGKSLARFIRQRYPAALIDEFQDTDPVQYRIFRTVYGNRDDTALFLIGDPKQAIYGFRGADIYSYLKAAADAGEASHTMTTNWRSGPGIISAVNALFRGNDRPFFEERIHFPEVHARPGSEELWHGGAMGEEPLQFLSVFSSEEKRMPESQFMQEAPRLIAADIVRLLTSDALIGERPVKPQDIAVLVRTNKQAAELQEALNRVGVRAVLQSRENVFASEEAYELFRLLKAVAEPSDERVLRSALTTDLYGFSAQELVALDREEAKWQQVLEQFYRWRRIWLTKGFMQAARTMGEELHFAERFLPYDNGERFLTNIRHLFELLHAEERDRHHKISSLLAWFAKQRKQAAKGESSPSEEVELRLESDADAVQIVTIHKSKGLEYPIVYCPYLWQAKRPPDSRRMFVSYHDSEEEWAGKIALVADDTSLSLHTGERFAEELRLLYVALTRAKHCCFLLWAATANYHQSALAYLLHGHLVSDKRESGPGSWFIPLKGLTAAELLLDLEQKSGGQPQWSLRSIDPNETVAPYRPEVAKDMEFECRKLQKPLPAGFTVASFSSVTAARKEIVFRPEVERDHDELAAVMKPAPEPVAEIPLSSFPKGATAGNFFHKVFELCDFQHIDGQGLEQIVAEQLRYFGFAGDQWLKPVSSAVEDILNTPLTDPPFRLTDIAAEKKLTELPFIFPVSYEEEAAVPFLPYHLADVFRRFPGNLPDDYAARIAELGFSPLKGYLKGFIDLVFEHNNQWYLVDYKSNHLGERLEDYKPARLSAVMSDHHYYLQYHIYTVALHRYLTQRLPGYDYRVDFGGIFYLFIKGMNSAAGPEYGIYFDRPQAERIEMLSNLLASPVPQEL